MGINKSKAKGLLTLLVAVTIAGCASPKLTNAQKEQMSQWEHKGLLVAEKDESLAAFLGLLPGAGSFYTERYAGVMLDAVTYPVSILWAPSNAYNTAQTENYYATLSYTKRKKKQNLNELDELRKQNKISKEQFLEKRISVRNKY